MQFYCFESITPVILDTDIGTDFDDSWALALLLKKQNQTIDLKMVLTASFDTYGRAQIVAKYLTSVKRGDIPIGVGIKTKGTILEHFKPKLDLFFFR